MTDQRTNMQCPKCGMPVAEGDEPTTRDGQTFCCAGCADGGECTCARHEHG